MPQVLHYKDLRHLSHPNAHDVQTQAGGEIQRQVAPERIYILPPYAPQFVVMLVQSHIAVQQRRRAVNALLRRLVLYGNNIAVAVGLYARVRQAPFQDGVIVVYDLVRLQVRAQHLHRQGQGFRALYAAYHVKALHLHFFHKVPCGIAVIIHPRREQVVFADGFAEPLRYVGIADSISLGGSKSGKPWDRFTASY